MYISPEMITHNVALFGSDLWALGWIIYECLTCKSPFFGDKNDFQLEENIKDASFTFPQDFPSDAKDLVKKLLKKSPFHRLGAGPKGSKNSLKKLKGHPFFNGMSFSKCPNKVPPINLSDFSKFINEKTHLRDQLKM
jgi:3-phosphoinositide dependent protein kinase-1